jgi:hypothetical protein
MLFCLCVRVCLLQREIARLGSREISAVERVWSIEKKGSLKFWVS